MKYTRYILYGNPINTNGLGAIYIPAMIAGIPILFGFLIGASIIDSNRYIKLRYLLYQREQYRLNYIKCVLRSLGHVESQKNIQMLKAA